MGGEGTGQRQRGRLAEEGLGVYLSEGTTNQGNLREEPRVPRVGEGNELKSLYFMPSAHYLKLGPQEAGANYDGAPGPERPAAGQSSSLQGRGGGS